MLSLLTIFFFSFIPRSSSNLYFIGQRNIRSIAYGCWHFITNLLETRSAVFEPFDLNKFCVVNDVMHRKFNKYKHIRTYERLTTNTTIDMLGKPTHITLEKWKYTLSLYRADTHTHTYMHVMMICRAYQCIFAYINVRVCCCLVFRKICEISPNGPSVNRTQPTE